MASLRSAEGFEVNSHTFSPVWTGALFVSISSGAALKSSGKLDLDHPMCLEQMFLQTADVAIGSKRSAGEGAQQIQRSCGFLPVYTHEPGDAGALVYCSSGGLGGRLVTPPPNWRHADGKGPAAWC